MRSRRRSCCGRTPTLRGDPRYERGNRKEWKNDILTVLSGCGIVVLVIVLTYVVYAVLLVHSGWRGR